MDHRAVAAVRVSVGPRLRRAALLSAVLALRKVFEAAITDRAHGRAQMQYVRPREPARIARFPLGVVSRLSGAEIAGVVGDAFHNKTSMANFCAECNRLLRRTIVLFGGMSKTMKKQKKLGRPRKVQHVKNYPQCPCVECRIKRSAR